MDLDADGDPEAMIGEHWDPSVVWPRANGVGFGWPVVTTTGVTQGALEAADLDGDGDDDVVVAGDGSVVWLENTGGALPAPLPVGPARSLSFAVVASDVDRDGDPDLIVASARVDLFENLGGGVFGPPETLSEASPYELDVFDADGDGDEDAAVLTGTRVTWLENPLPGVDADRDGYLEPADCLDSDPSVHPGAVEDCTNGLDDDCDGLVDCPAGETGETGLPAGPTGDTAHTGLDPAVHTGSDLHTGAPGEVHSGAAPTDGETDAPQVEGEPSGCGCASDGAGAGAWLAGVVALGIRLRRRHPGGRASWNTASTRCPSGSRTNAA